jgi:hypothetical protein
VAWVQPQLPRVGLIFEDSMSICDFRNIFVFLYYFTSRPRHAICASRSSIDETRAIQEQYRPFFGLNFESLGSSMGMLYPGHPQVNTCG